MVQQPSTDCRLLQPCNIAYLLLSIPAEDIPEHLSTDEQLAMRESDPQHAHTCIMQTDFGVGPRSSTVRNYQTSQLVRSLHNCRTGFSLCLMMAMGLVLGQALVSSTPTTSSECTLPSAVLCRLHVGAAAGGRPHMHRRHTGEANTVGKMILHV